MTLVHPLEASMPDGKLSVESPVGKALLGAAKGDEVELADPARRQAARDPRRRLSSARPQSLTSASNAARDRNRPGHPADLRDHVRPRLRRRGAAGRKAAEGARQAGRLGLRDDLRRAGRRDCRRPSRLHHRELRLGQGRPLRQPLLRLRPGLVRRRDRRRDRSHLVGAVAPFPQPDPARRRRSRRSRSGTRSGGSAASSPATATTASRGTGRGR